MEHRLLLVLGVVALVLVAWVISGFVSMFLWNWIIPDLMPGLVASGAANGAIGFTTGLKISIWLFLMGAGYATRARG